MAALELGSIDAGYSLKSQLLERVIRVIYLKPIHICVRIVTLPTNPRGPLRQQDYTRIQRTLDPQRKLRFCMLCSIAYVQF